MEPISFKSSLEKLGFIDAQIHECIKKPKKANSALLSALETLLQDSDEHVICNAQLCIRLLLPRFGIIKRFSQDVLPRLMNLMTSDRHEINFNTIHICRLLHQKAATRDCLIQSLVRTGLDNRNEFLCVNMLNLVQELNIRDQSVINRVRNLATSSVSDQVAVCLFSLLKDEYLDINRLASPDRTQRAQTLQILLQNPGMVSEFPLNLQVCISDSVLQSQTILFIEKLLSNPKFCTAKALESLFEASLARLGDTRINSRQSFFKLFKFFISKFTPNDIYPRLMQALLHKNWLIRLEILHIIISGMIMNSRCYDFLTMVPQIAQLLDDPKPKIRFSATEALAVVEHFYSSEKIVPILSPIVDHQALEFLIARFSDRKIATLQEYNLDFPKIRSLHSSSSPYLSTRNTTGFGILRNQFKDKTCPKQALSESFGPHLRSVTRLEKLITPNKKRLLEPEDKGVYLKYEDLTRLDCVESSVAQIESISEQSEWTEIFEGINLARRLYKFNTAESKESLRVTLKFLSKQSESLRSSLSKNALIALGEASLALGPSMDRFLTQILKSLMQRVCDSNSFISTEARESIQKLCRNSSASRIAASIQKTFPTTKNAEIKAMICVCYRTILESEGFLSSKEFPQALNSLSESLFDASADVRSQARLAFKTLEAHNNYQEILETHCNPKIVSRILDRSPKKRVATPKIEKTRMDNGELSRLLFDISSIDSKSRLSGLSALEKFIDDDSGILAKSQKLGMIIEILTKTLQDRNLKVLLKGLELIKKMATKLGSGIGPYLGSLLDASVSTLNSKNENVKTLSLQICQILVKQGDSTRVFLGLSNILHELPKSVKEEIERDLVSMMPLAYKRKPAIVRKRTQTILEHEYRRKGELKDLEEAWTSLCKQIL